MSNSRSFFTSPFSQKAKSSGSSRSSPPPGQSSARRAPVTKAIRGPFPLGTMPSDIPPLISWPNTNLSRNQHRGNASPTMGILDPQEYQWSIHDEMAVPRSRRRINILHQEAQPRGKENMSRKDLGSPPATTRDVHKDIAEYTRLPTYEEAVSAGSDREEGSAVNEGQRTCQIIGEDGEGVPVVFCTADLGSRGRNESTTEPDNCNVRNVPDVPTTANPSGHWI